MVLAVLAACVLAAPAQGGKQFPGEGLVGPAAKLFREVIDVPTGQNGYEDYVEAAARLEYPDHLAFLTWRGYWQASARGTRPVREGKSEALVPEPPRPPGLSLEATPLQVRQAYVKRWGILLETIRRGNAKPVFQPRKTMDFSTNLPELGRFKDIAKLLVDRAMDEFATGSSQNATDTLLESLKFSNNIEDGALINGLVGFAIQAITLAGFDRGLGRLTLGDANQIVKACNELLARPPAAVKTMEQEFAFIAGGLGKAANNPKALWLSDEEPEDDLYGAFSQLSPGDRQTVVEKALGHLATMRDSTLSRVRGPESKWTRFSGYELPVAPAEQQTSDGLARRLVNVMTPVVEPYFEANAKARAQLRILRLIARVIAYRWTFDKLPQTLADAAPAAELTDPTSGGEFKYETNGKTFRVYSLGTGKSGEVDLVYRRPMLPGQRDRDPDEPPSAHSR